VQSTSLAEMRTISTIFFADADGTVYGVIATETWKNWEGQLLEDRYYLHRYFSSNQSSAVFLTEITGGEARKAAIKLVDAKSDTAEALLARWDKAAKLSHPRLIQLFESGRSKLGDTPLLYVVMEYAEENLSLVLPERPLTVAEAEEMLEPTLDALAYLHGLGLVHGDVKPSNIMAVDDQLKISSDVLSSAGESKASGQSVYDPPEIARGLLPASDVWSLGVTLVEALTQHPPAWRDKERRELLLPETIPQPFADIIRHSLRPDPQSRCSVADIKARLHGVPIPTKPEPAIVTTSELPAKNRTSVVVATVFIVALAAFAGMRLFQRAPDTVPPNPVPPPPAVQKEPAPSALPPLQPQSQPKAKATPPRKGANGDVFRQVLPDVPRHALNTIRGSVKVDVKVTVAPSGEVTSTRLDSAGPSKYFANLALQAARQWKFSPADADAQNTPRAWRLRFEFTRSGTKVTPVRSTP
jgi:TonB family protein